LKNNVILFLNFHHAIVSANESIGARRGLQMLRAVGNIIAFVSETQGSRNFRVLRRIESLGAFYPRQFVVERKTLEENAAVKLFSRQFDICLPALATLTDLLTSTRILREPALFLCLIFLYIDEINPQTSSRSVDFHLRE